MALKLDPGLASAVLAPVYRMLLRTWRYDRSEARALFPGHDTGTRYVAALWHNELTALTSLGVVAGYRLGSVVSQSKDGEFLARTLERLGFHLARGSSSRGGLQALRQARRLIDDGRVLAITVDGPKGPPRKVKDGVFFIAQKTNSFIQPLRVLDSGAFVFEKSWDKFRVPYPFSRLSIRRGEPYMLEPGKLDADRLAHERARLEATLEALGR